MDDAAETHSEVFQSWQDHLFNFNLAVPAIGTPGLRKPQVAALYASLGHLIVDPSSTATVVMPTVTGKTDTTLALFIAGRLPRTLILVPSDALRTQLVNKCKELKKLREIGAVSDTLVRIPPSATAVSASSHLQITRIRLVVT